MKTSPNIIICLAVACMTAGSALAQGAGQGRTLPTPEQRAARFDGSDANKDGSLNKEEFKALLPPRQQERADAVWRNVDADGDGKVSKEEFLSMRPGRRQQQ